MKMLLGYRILQLVSLLLGVRVFRLMFFTFALYVSAFFLMKAQGLGENGFEAKIHGIIFCSVLSIAAGGLINQFYDQEKDRILKPFRSQFQRFLKQKYTLYFYLLLNILSLSISVLLSWRIFAFFLIYQFLIWFYSHKLSKKLILNNLCYVWLLLYPSFGLLVYFKYFSGEIFLLSVFLFLLLLTMDILKDMMSVKGDRLLEYQTLPVIWGEERSLKMLRYFLMLNMMNSMLIFQIKESGLHSYYYILSIIFFGILSLALRKSSKYKYFAISVLLKIWLFVGLIFMLLSSIVR